MEIKPTEEVKDKLTSQNEEIEEASETPPENFWLRFKQLGFADGVLRAATLLATVLMMLAMVLLL